MRSLAREAVYKYIYSKLFNQDEGLLAVLIKELNEVDKEFALAIYDGVVEKENIYLSTLEKLAERYNLNRILLSDRCAILVAMAELDKFPDTPKPVVIDEAVKIARKYSTEKSTDFVNGILAQYIKG